MNANSNAELAGLVSHDFGNIISAMILRLSLLRQESNLSESVKNGLWELEAEAARARFLMRYLVQRPDDKCQAKRQSLDLNRLISNSLRTLPDLLGHRVKLSFEPSRDTAWVIADPSLITDLIVNVCLYPARTALFPIELTLKTSLAKFPRDANSSIEKGRSGNYICLSLTESGDGAGAPNLDAEGSKLTQLLFNEMTAQMDGWTEARSEGTNKNTILFFLPAAKAEATAMDRPEMEKKRPNEETILVVEDEAALRRVIVLSLRKLGYAVLEAATEEEALGLWRKERNRIDLLFADMVMPGATTGLTLAKTMREEKNTVKVIISSGYKISAEAHQNLGEVTFVTKPYDLPEVAATVRRCLDESVKSFR